MNTLTFETSVSDDHKLIGTMLRSTFAKGKHKETFYRFYKNFGHEKFEEELKKDLYLVLDFESFHLVFKTTLDRFAPLKQKVVQNNNQPFVTKKPFVKLRNKFNKERKAKSWFD